MYYIYMIIRLMKMAGGLEEAWQADSRMVPAL